MTTLELLLYYANLLILQYVGKSQNFAAIETLVRPVLMAQTSVEAITFSDAPTSGTFVLSYGDDLTATLHWNDSVSTIQSAIRAISGLSTITVTGSLASKSLTVTFTGVTAPALLLSVHSNTLLVSAQNVEIEITETDDTLPLAVQNGFNLIGDSLSQGVQLDVLGKYVGVTRLGFSSSGAVVLDDTSFLTLIKLAISKNSAQSSLSAIQSFIHFFFPDQILVFDYSNMQMSYLISTSLGSEALIETVVTQNLLPKPMGVSLATLIFAADINAFFGFQTYALWALGIPIVNNSPFNTYASYNLTSPWLSYSDAVIF